jgi:hypothetical protein
MTDQALPVASESTVHPPSRSARNGEQNPSPRNSSGRCLFAFVWAFAAIGIAIGAWSLATPLMAAPDEPIHVVEATAVVRGQIDVPKQPGRLGVTSLVQVPEWAAETGALPG